MIVNSVLVNNKIKNLRLMKEKYTKSRRCEKTPF